MKIGFCVVIIIEPGQRPEMRELPYKLDHKKQECKKGQLTKTISCRHATNKCGQRTRKSSYKYRKWRFPFKRSIDKRIQNNRDKTKNTAKRVRVYPQKYSASNTA